MPPFVIIYFRVLYVVLFCIFVIFYYCASVYDLKIFFLTCVTLLIISFYFLVYISDTLGDCCLANSDRSTLGAWLSVTVTLGVDDVLLVSFR